MDKCIVLMWATNTGSRNTGRLERRDGEWREVFETAPKAHACVYSRDLKDVDRALAYAGNVTANETDKYCVKVAIMDYADGVLEKARASVLAELAKHDDGYSPDGRSGLTFDGEASFTDERR